MPWEKSFDVDQATEKALAVFWDKGYEATSMSDLIGAMGINKGSLYNAFGSKKGLFLQALQRYGTGRRRRLLTRLDAVHPAKDAIEAFFDTLVEESIKDPFQRGCLLINTSLEFPHHDAEVQTLVSEGLGETEAFFAGKLRQGQEDGDIPEALNADEVARGLMALVVGLRVLARGVADEAHLRDIKRQAMALIDAPS